MIDDFVKGLVSGFLIGVFSVLAGFVIRGVLFPW